MNGRRKEKNIEMFILLQFQKSWALFFLVTIDDNIIWWCQKYFIFIFIYIFFLMENNKHAQPLIGCFFIYFYIVWLVLLHFFIGRRIFFLSQTKSFTLEGYEDSLTKYTGCYQRLVHPFTGLHSTQLKPKIILLIW